ncbi:hypothetical protein Bca52824_074494 [Brassica carinata]|uniref:Uncharacterized protein n=1 Tax=Brassica carinata TaxID=52824 RepID=A0A8X7PPE8_BRACI|nr:hypothetical protein Bca52824_074494 [Brassica carinata]
MIFGAMRNFDYGSDEAVQESKKGGERDASVSLSSPERSRIRKSVEGISMLASTEFFDHSRIARDTTNSHRIPHRILTTNSSCDTEEGEMRIEILKDEIEENRACIANWIYDFAHLGFIPIGRENAVVSF